MDSFEFNKFAMAMLGTVFLVMSLTFIADGIFYSPNPQTQGYAIEAEEEHSAGGGETAEASGPAYEPVTSLLASADIGKGQKIAKKCLACHVFEEGGKNKAGPMLYGIVNRPMASTEGFSYSTALKAYAAGKTWTYDELNGFLWKPKKYLKGTAMGFAGIKKVGDRAAVIGFLRSLATSPAPLPAGE